MSVHVELDVAADGTVVMTGRPAKGAEIGKTAFGPAVGNGVVVLPLCAGEDNTRTHCILLGTMETIKAIQSLTRAGSKPGSVMLVVAEWAS